MGIGNIVREKIKSLATSGELSQAEISHQVGRSREYIRQVLLRESIDLPKKRRYCPSCGKVLPRNFGPGKCPACVEKARAERRKKTWATYSCYLCGCEVERQISEQERNEKVFCTKQCFGRWLGLKYGYGKYTKRYGKGGISVIQYKVIDATEVPPKAIQAQEIEKLLEALFTLEQGKALIVTCNSKSKANSLKGMLAYRLAKQNLECHASVRGHRSCQAELFLWDVRSITD